MAGLSALHIVLLVVGVLVLVVLVRRARLGGHDRSWATLRPWLARLIERRFGGYEQLLEPVDTSAPLHLEQPRRVLVIGGGLAGIGAAANLAERGFDVTLREKENYLGGKIGAWHVETESGEQLEVEHGFHAFFRHYYNLLRFLDKTGVRQNLVPIDDYLILGDDGRRYQFRDVEPVPVLNLIALARSGLYRFSDILFGPALHEMDVFLEYDEKHTFEELDDVSYREFAERAELPASLRLVFNTFARAFFAEDDRMSMAELVKSFHFFYLSHDHGLLYDYPADDYQTSVIGPIRAHLDRQGVKVELGKGALRVAPAASGLNVDGEHFDHVVLATSSVAARRIAEACPEIARADPTLGRQLAKMRASQRYAVLRLWLDRDLREDVPVFFATERERVLDAVTAYHRITAQARRFAAKCGGSVIELHSYALPDDVAESDVRDLLLEEMYTHLPELRGATVVHEHLQVNANFTAFHVGMQADRPTTETAIDGLVLAGDWVKLPIPAMLMEGAYSAGLIAANAVLRSAGLRENPVYTVPRKGLLTGLRPTRKRSVQTRPRAEPVPGVCSAIER